MKKGFSMTQSFQNTTSSMGGQVSQVFPLKYLLKNCPLTTFEISVINADGTRKTESVLGGGEVEPINKKKGKKKLIVGGGKSNASKIQFLLDQRKPPTEKLPSLCCQYDDDLNKVDEDE